VAKALRAVQMRDIFKELLCNLAGQVDIARHDELVIKSFLPADIDFRAAEGQVLWQGNPEEKGAILAHCLLQL